MRRSYRRPLMTLPNCLWAFLLFAAAACGVGNRADRRELSPADTTMPSPASHATSPIDAPPPATPVAATLQTATFALG